MMTSNEAANPSSSSRPPWLDAFAEIMRLVSTGSKAEVCGRVRALFNGLDHRQVDYTNPLNIALETIASAGFQAAYDQERFDHAYEFAIIADEIAERISDYRYGRARTLNNLALACMERGDLVRSESLFERALTFIDPDEDTRGLAGLIGSNLSAMRGMRGQAVVHSVSHPSDFVRPRFPYPKGEWATRNLRALELRDEGKTAEAIAELEDILSASDLDLDTASRATLLSNLGSALYQAGDLTSAKTTLLKARAFCEDNGYSGQVLAGILNELGQVQLRTQERDESLASFKEAWDIIRSAAPRSRTALLILLHLGTARLTGRDQQRARACFERGLAIYDAMREDIASTERDHQGLFIVYRALSERLIWLSVHQGRYLETLQLMQQAKARYWSARLKRLTRQGGEKLPAEFDEEEIRKVIGFNGALIEFFVGPNATFVFLAYNRWFQAYRVDVTEGALSTLVDELRKRLEAGLRGVEVASRLSHLLFEKARFDWKTLRMVLLAPDGPLWRIPLDVLPAPKSSQRSDALGTLAPVAYIPSASLIRQMHQWEKKTADPVFITLVHDRPSDAPVLAGARQEVAAIRSILEPHMMHVAIGGESGVVATPENIAERLRTATYIHIAAHAYADERDTDAFILLADGRGEDDRLTASKIETLDLSAQLVVLAACHSSFGRSSPGEGMVGLARSFLLAGARSVAASLWELNDEHSVRFFTYLYTYITEETSPARAFQRAKEAYAHAFGRDETWAGLTIIGDADSAEDRYSSRYIEVPETPSF